MSSWQTFPEASWSPIGGCLSGFGPGEGTYGMAYALEEDSGQFLNGRVSATVRLAGNRAINGAGVVFRASASRSFAAFYLVTDDTTPDLYSVRLAASKFGKLNLLVGLKNSIKVPGLRFQIAAQFFSGDVVGQVVTDLGTHT
ncbi:MAG: hypothetical protein ACREAC_19680, partial [Blastocatellia bacterium]